MNDMPTGSFPIATVNGTPIYLPDVPVPINSTMTIVVTIR